MMVDDLYDVIDGTDYTIDRDRAEQLIARIRAEARSDTVEAVLNWIAIQLLNRVADKHNGKEIANIIQEAGERTW